jgi:hypothetical protein
MLKIKTAVAAFSFAMLWTSNAFAGVGGCWFFCGGGPGSGGPSPAPEIDGPASLTAVALLISVGAIAYRKFKG